MTGKAFIIFTGFPGAVGTLFDTYLDLHAWKEIYVTL